MKRISSTEEDSRKRTITSWFKPTTDQALKTKAIESANTSAGDNSCPEKKVAECLPPSLNVITAGTSSSQPHQEHSKSSKFHNTQSTCSSSAVVYENDIGLYIGAKPVSRIIYNILQDHWEPPIGYKYPSSSHMKRGKLETRFLKREHLEKYKSWVVLSHTQQGLYCKFCPFFASGRMGGHNKGNALRTLVTEPLKKFAKLLGKEGDLECHGNSLYHQEAVRRANDFLIAYQNPEKSVDNQVDSYKLKRTNENRERLMSSLQNVIFLGKQNIPFRGHRDDGLFSKNDKYRNEGNFRELMRFRIEECGNSYLSKQCESVRHRSSFISKTVQNDLIKCCGEEILVEILNRVKDSGIYSIGFDETTDVSHKTQLTIFLRYVNNRLIREDFIGFWNPRESFCNGLLQNQCTKQIETEAGSSSSDNDENFSDDDSIEDPRMTGEKLGQTVLEIIHYLNIDPKKCVGIATDGCSVMTSELVGAVTVIKKECQTAERSPCFNHALNLSISKCSTVQAARNAIGIIREVVSFFTASPKRNSVLVKHVGKQLIAMCETRWVERHLSVETFLKHFEGIVASLEEVAQWSQFSTDNSTVIARTLLCSIRNGEFVITLVCLSDMLSQTLPLSRLFQKESIELGQATSFLKDTLSVLEQKRVNADVEFGELFKEAEKLAEDIGSEVKVSRLTSKQVHRQNAAASCSPEAYYRVNIFIPILESIIIDLKNRFPSGVLDLYRLNSILPKVCTAPSFCEATFNTDAKVLADKYCRILDEDSKTFLGSLKSEFKIWLARWQREKKENNNSLPSYAVDCLEFCVPEMLPHVHLLLMVLATLPVSTASAERSFSTLKLTKTWLRNRCGQSRLTGLALMFIHRDIEINRENVIDRYIEKGGKGRKNLFS